MVSKIGIGSIGKGGQPSAPPRERAPGFQSCHPRVMRLTTDAKSTSTFSAGCLCSGRSSEPELGGSSPGQEPGQSGNDAGTRAFCADGVMYECRRPQCRSSSATRSAAVDASKRRWRPLRLSGAARVMSKILGAGRPTWCAGRPCDSEDSGRPPSGLWGACPAPPEPSQLLPRTHCIEATARVKCRDS